MTAESILEQTAKLLEITIDLSDPQERETRLLACLGYVLSELTERYATLRERESVIATDGKVLFRTLHKKAIKILSLERDGKKVRFCCFPDCIRVERDGAYEITYAYGLSEPTSITETIKLPPAYTEETLAIGVAAEYLHRTARDTEADFYAQRYMTAIKNAASERKNIVMPSRSFL